VTAQTIHRGDSLNISTESDNVCYVNLKINVTREDPGWQAPSALLHESAFVIWLQSSLALQ